MHPSCSSRTGLNQPKTILILGNYYFHSPFSFFYPQTTRYTHSHLFLPEKKKMKTLPYPSNHRNVFLPLLFHFEEAPWLIVFMNPL